MPPDVVPAVAAGALTAPREEIASRLSDPRLVILDVLPRDSYESGHIPGALSLPVEEIEARAPSLVPDRHQEIVVYCGSDT